MTEHILGLHSVLHSVVRSVNGKAVTVFKVDPRNAKAIVNKS